MADRRVKDTFCSFCGTKYAEPLAYPRTCASCKVTVWANPIPVAVVLVQVTDGPRTGLLVVRRAIPPGVGKLALVGGFVEEQESWQQGGAREVLEEAGLTVDPERLMPMWYASSEPNPNRVLLFSIAPPIKLADLTPFSDSGGHDAEASERGVIFGPDGLDAEFAFSLHIEAARRYFAARRVAGPHDFRPA